MKLERMRYTHTHYISICKYNNTENKNIGLVDHIYKIFCVRAMFRKAWGEIHMPPIISN